MAATTITLRPEHGYVMLAAGVLSFEVFAIGGAVGLMRGKLFGKEYKKRPGVVALFEEHKKACGSVPFCSQGYPDMGSGRFAAELTYAEWLAFNNAQRGHQNALETLPGVLACLFAAGAVYPVTASALAGLYGVGRPLYAWCARGPRPQLPCAQPWLRRCRVCSSHQGLSQVGQRRAHAGRAPRRRRPLWPLWRGHPRGAQGCGHRLRCAGDAFRPGGAASLASAGVAAAWKVT